VSEKNNGDEFSLRRVDSDAEQGSSAAGADWMDALGVAPPPGGEAPRTSPPESKTTPSDPDWMTQLGGSGAEPPLDLATDEDEWAGSAQSPGPGRRRERTLAVALIAGLGVLIAGVSLLALAQMSGGENEPDNIAADLDQIQAESGAAAQVESAPAEEFACEESESGGTITGAGAGDTKSVAGVILAFEHAYYSARDAEKALDLTSDDSTLVNVDALQEGIDSVPKGTEHCVSITPDGDTATVEITEVRPSQAPQTFVQEITTSRDGDRVEIVEIAEEEQ